MRYQRAQGVHRREFLEGLALAATVGLLGWRPASATAAPPPETTTLRLTKPPSTCMAPQYIAEELLQAEGFTEVQYVKTTGGAGTALTLAAGEADLSMAFAGPLIVRIDAGDPLVVLAGGHIGCFELFGTERVRTIRDLKGKTVAVPEMGGSYHLFIAMMAAYVGLDPHKDITWVVQPVAEAIRLFTAGQIDAFLAFPPVPLEFRSQQIGHVVVNSTMDRPWSQYFCCMLTGNQAFVRQSPVATKRALRAILRAADICALEPERVATSLVDKGFTPRYDYALQLMQDLPYAKWPDYNPEDTMRFYALRLHEIGMIKSSPQKIITEGTDWRFFNELKQELKR